VTVRRGVLVLTAAAIVGLYFGGRLDHLLYNVGLNYNACARNGFGAVFCGRELTQYQQRVQGVQQQVQLAQQRLCDQFPADCPQTTTTP
jgi:thiamine pyrophosphokinase